MTSPGTAAGLKSLLKSERLSIQAAAIELGRDQVLNPEFDVPVESAQNLDEVVRAEIDRRTPFSPDEVYYTYRVAGTDTEMKRLIVRLWIAKADFIDEAAQIALTAGLSPVRIGVDGDLAAANNQAPIDLLPPSLAGGRAPYFSRLAWGLALAILIMGGATIHLSFENRHAVLTAAEARATTLRQDRQAEEKARKQLDDLVTVANAIFEKRRSKMSSIILLDELTKRLPDSSWLQQLAVNGEKASISGYSRNSSSLVRSLGKGKVFQGHPVRRSGDARPAPQSRPVQPDLRHCQGGGAMMETQPLWLRRFVALGLLLCVVLAGLLYVAIPLVEASGDLDRRIESRQHLNARLSERSFDPKAHEQQAAEIKESLGERGVYLKAGTVALASVELGEYLQSVITQHRARLQSRQSLGKQVDGPVVTCCRAGGAAGGDRGAPENPS